MFFVIGPGSNPVADGGLGGLNYPLAADMTKQLSRDYGVLLEDKGVALPHPTHCQQNDQLTAQRTK